MKHIAALVLACLLTQLLTQVAQATIHNYEAVMDGLQETPPVATPGAGYATVTLDDVALTYVVSGTFSGLLGTTTAAHIHGPAAIGEGPAGILVGLAVDLGVTSGNVSGNGSLTNTQMQTILDGLSYINIHTTSHPAGEIRGQIVPEPGTLGLLTLGAAVLLARRRR